MFENLALFEKRHKKIFFAGLAILVFIIILIILAFQSGFQQGLADTIRGFGVFSPAIFFLVQFAESIFPFFPGFILTVMAGYLFGPLVGTIIAVLAVLTGSTVAFFIARKLEKSIFHNLPQRELRHFEKFVEKKGDYAILLARILPIFPNVVVSFSAGLTKMSYWHFLLFSLIGLVPQQLVLAFFGFSLDQFSKLSIFFAIVFVLFLAIFAFRHKIKRLLIKEWNVIERDIERDLKKIEKVL
jgi:uncharacterized membrane protein YdjX (TVP38/TMEM64 family)